MRKSSRSLSMVCGFVRIGRDCKKLWVPAPMLYLDAVTWAHELLEMTIDLLWDAKKKGQLKEEYRERTIARAIKQWIEDPGSVIDDVPALAHRARIKPLVIGPDWLPSYTRKIGFASKDALEDDKAVFVLDFMGIAGNAQFFGTAAVKGALLCSGDISAVMLSDAEFLAWSVQHREPIEW